MLAETVLLFAAALAGFFVFRVCHLPTPAFLGPMLFAGALNYFYLYPDISLDVPSFFAKIVLGVTLGRTFNRGMLSTLRELPLPALITSLWMMGASLIAGFFLHYWSDLPLGTALIGSAAGGVIEMAVFAMALGFDAVTVTFIQIFRLITSIITVPLIARAWQKNYARRGTESAAQEAKPQAASIVGKFQVRHYILLSVVTLIAGGLCELVHIPAGAMLGALFGSAFVVLAIGRECVLSSWVTRLAQMFLGVIIAESMTHDTLVALADLFLPLFVPTVVLLVLCLALSLILARVTHWDPMTCILATMPAGLIQIVPIADEYGANVLQVAVMHTVRLISIVCLLPWIIRFIISL